MTIPEVDNIISVFSLLTPTQTAQVNQVKKKAEMCLQSLLRARDIY